MNTIVNKTYLKVKHTINSCYSIVQLDVLNQYVELYLNIEQSVELKKKIQDLYCKKLKQLGY